MLTLHVRQEGRIAHGGIESASQDVEPRRGHVEPQDGGRKASVRQQVPVRLAERVGERGTLDPAPVDEEDLALAGRARMLGKPEQRSNA